MAIKYNGALIERDGKQNIGFDFIKSELEKLNLKVAWAEPNEVKAELYNSQIVITGYGDTEYDGMLRYFEGGMIIYAMIKDLETVAGILEGLDAQFDFGDQDSTALGECVCIRMIHFFSY